MFEFLAWFVPMIAALFLGAGGGKYLRPLLNIIPRLVISDFRPFRHHHELEVWRIAVKNEGKEVSKNIQADVVEVYDNGKNRQNFLPVPLRWTHQDGSIQRDIAPEQTVFLDVIEFITAGGINDINCNLRLATSFAGGISDFTEVRRGETKIKLRFFSTNSKSFEIISYIKWDGDLLLDAKVKGRKWYWNSNKK